MITKSIILNAWENNKQKVLAVQGEVGARWLDITLLDEKIPLDLTNCFVVIYMDTGVVIYNTCEITDALNGQISVELTKNMSGIYGDFEAEIHVYDELGNLLKIKGLEITIRKSTDVTVTVEARDEFTALQQALSTVGEYRGRIDTNVTDILTNAENIAENREDIDENRTNIGTNANNIQTLDANKADKTMAHQIGEVTMFAGNTAPTGFLLCQGQTISRSTYADLFNVIGTIYGAGNGSTTFNIPNWCGKTPVGLDTTQTEFNTLGKIGGEKTHTLTVAELAKHSHMVQSDYYNNSGNSKVIANAWGVAENEHSTTTTGENQPHNNLQPYGTTNFIIYTGV